MVQDQEHVHSCIVISAAVHASDAVVIKQLALQDIACAIVARHVGSIVPRGS